MEIEDAVAVRGEEVPVPTLGAGNIFQEDPVVVVGTALVTVAAVAAHVPVPMNFAHVLQVQHTEDN
jgi:hypothetical protein